jgi:hypothetical protein
MENSWALAYFVRHACFTVKMSATSSWTLASFSGSKGAMLYSQYAACTIGVHMVPPFFLAKKHGK